MESANEPAKPGEFALRSLVLPAAASAVVAFMFGMVWACEPFPGAWILLAAPVFALIGAVGGPAHRPATRVRIWLISCALNLLAMLLLVMLFTWRSCSF